MDFNPSWVMLKVDRGWGRYDSYSLSSITIGPSLPKRIYTMAIPILRTENRDYLFIRDDEHKFDTVSIHMIKNKSRVHTNKKLWEQLSYKARDVDTPVVV